MGDSPLALDAEQMRRLGYRTIDLLVDRLTGDPGPVLVAATPEELRSRLASPPPVEPTDDLSCCPISASPLMMERQVSSGPLRKPFWVTLTPSGEIATM